MNYTICYVSPFYLRQRNCQKKITFPISIIQLTTSISMFLLFVTTVVFCDCITDKKQGLKHFSERFIMNSDYCEQIWLTTTNSRYLTGWKFGSDVKIINNLSTNPIKWSNTLKQFVVHLKRLWVKYTFQIMKTLVKWIKVMKTSSKNWWSSFIS